VRPSRSLPGLICAALLALLAAAPAASARDAIVTSFDGTKLITHFFPAQGLRPGAKAPNVLVGHGYGMTGETDPESTSDDLFGQVGLGPLRRAGYNVLTWDARGFGGSGGQVEIDSKDFEGRDVQALITHVAKQPEAQLDRAGDPRLGMSGVSYGGSIQLVTAAIDKRVDVITPTIAWNSLIASLYKEGVVKTGWGSVLSGAGGTSITNGLFSPAGFQTGNQDPRIYRALAEGLATGRFSAASQAFFRSRDTAPLVKKVKVPTLLIEGTADTLFTLHESIANQAILRRNGVPVRLVWFCGGHGVCLANKGPIQNVEKSVISWFSRYLKRQPSVRTGAPFSYVAQDGKERDGVTFPPVPSGSVSARSSGTLPLSPDSGGGALIASSPSANAFNLDLPAFKGPAEAVGEPRLDLTYSGTGSPQDTHVFAQLVDTQSNLVLGNQAVPIPVALDGKQHTISRPMEAIAFHAVAGAKLRLQISPATTLYSQQRSTGLLQFASVAVKVPLVNLKARPRLRLLIGATKGMRRARRGHPFRVRVRARPDKLRAVRVVVRNRKGRRVGRSKVFLLGGRIKKPRVKVTRKLRAGRYRITATGVTTAEGLSVKGTKRVNIRRKKRR
jgi:ABC-2 type transport system ATP-binding protein